MILTTELAMAVATIILGLVQLLLTTFEYRRVHGIAYANGARDLPSDKPESRLLGRLTRAQANFMETAPYFIGVTIIISVAGLSSSATQGAAIIFVGARVLFVPLYALGIAYVRGLVWTIGFGALLFLVYVAAMGMNWALPVLN